MDDIADVPPEVHAVLLSLAIALVLAAVMINWRRGQVVVTRNRVAKEGSLREFLDALPASEPPPDRVPGVASSSAPARRRRRWRYAPRSNTRTRSRRRPSSCRSTT